MNSETKSIQARLIALADPAYKAFHAKLIPTVDPDVIIGVRTPALRKLARELRDDPKAAAFCRALPHRYYDENNLHGLLIEGLRDYEEAIAAVEAFLPHVDNWATCDLLSPKAFIKRLPDLYERVKAWLRSDRTYTVRFGVDMLIRHFLDDAFQPEMLELAANAANGEYYIDMAVAWYFATALAKQYDEAVPFIEGRRLSAWTHNKTVQKAVESYRISDERKAYLKTLKVK